MASFKLGDEKGLIKYGIFLQSFLDKWMAFCLVANVCCMISTLPKRVLSLIGAV